MTTQKAKRRSSPNTVGVLVIAMMFGAWTPLVAQETDSTSAGKRATSVLFPAVVEGPPELVQVLILAGADLEIRDWQRRTPLMVALAPDFVIRDSSPRGSERVRLIRFLIEAGANVNARDRSGETPLMHASGFGESTILEIEMLLDAGANSRASSKHGSTALHEAASWNDDPTVAMTLILAGADMSATDWQGKTPLMRAAEHGSAAVVQALLDVGSDYDARDTDGYTALELAESRYHALYDADVVSVLRNAET